MKEIHLSQEKVALVDDEDYESIAQYEWYAHKPKGSKTFYAARREDDKMVLMHRQILGNECNNTFVDHKNGCGLDNKRDNIRICTNTQNQHNQQLRNTPKHSKFKGVTWHRKANKWYAQIRINKKNTYLGLFDNEIDAAKAYDKVARDNFGEFAYLNFNN